MIELVSPESHIGTSVCSNISNANQDVEVNFTYTITISPGSKPSLDEIVSSIDNILYKDAFDEMVDCSSKGTRRTLLRGLQTNNTLFTSAVGFNNVPVDKISTVEQCGSNCYVVDGGSTVLFPQEVPVESLEVRNTVQNYLKNKIGRGELNSIHPDIVGVEYRGPRESLLFGEGVTETIEENDESQLLTTNRVKGQKLSTGPSNDKPISVAGGIIIGSTCLIALLFVSIVISRKIRFTQLPYRQCTNDCSKSVLSDADEKEELHDNPEAPVPGGNQYYDLPSRTSSTSSSDKGINVNSFTDSPVTNNNKDHSSDGLPSHHVHQRSPLQLNEKEENQKIPSGHDIHSPYPLYNKKKRSAASTSSHHDVRRCNSLTCSVCSKVGHNDSAPRFVAVSDPLRDDSSLATPETSESSMDTLSSAESGLIIVSHKRSDCSSHSSRQYSAPDTVML